MKKSNFPNPLFQEKMKEAYQARAALSGNKLQITERIFVAGDQEPPKVSTKLIPVERIIEGQKIRHYEVRLEIDGVLLGEHASPPPLLGNPVKERLSIPQVLEYDKLFTSFVPDHLSIEPFPQKIEKPIRRIPKRLSGKTRYNTTIFGTDQRAVFQDTSYPWSAFGRCETNFGPFSGVMVGPRHLLTCNHGIDWTPPPGYAADWLSFTPAYYNGMAPFGSTYATHVYWVQKDNNDGFSNGNEGQYDYVVLVLNDRIGDITGWLGARRYSDSWDGMNTWWHIGYPSDLTSMERPIFQSWFSMNGDDNQDDAHQAIYHQADVFPGQSGGPMFGFWDGEVGPRAVAVQSWQNSQTNGASGGGDLFDLVVRARNEHP